MYETCKEVENENENENDQTSENINMIIDKNCDVMACTRELNVVMVKINKIIKKKKRKKLSEKF
jgi:hypothetical protein